MGDAAYMTSKAEVEAHLSGLTPDELREVLRDDLSRHQRGLAELLDAMNMRTKKGRVLGPVVVELAIVGATEMVPRILNTVMWVMDEIESRYAMDEHTLASDTEIAVEIAQKAREERDEWRGKAKLVQEDHGRLRHENKILLLALHHIYSLKAGKQTVITAIGRVNKLGVKFSPTEILRIIAETTGT